MKHPPLCNADSTSAKSFNSGRKFFQVKNNNEWMSGKRRPRAPHLILWGCCRLVPLKPIIDFSCQSISHLWRWLTSLHTLKQLYPTDRKYICKISVALVSLFHAHKRIFKYRLIFKQSGLQISSNLPGQESSCMEKQSGKNAQRKKTSFQMGIYFSFPLPLI